MPLSRSPALLAAVLAACCCSYAASAFAQAPSISGLSPQAVLPGATVDLKIQGNHLTGASMLWTSFPCEAVLAPDVKDNGTSAGELVYRITVPSELAVGVHGLRVVTPRGVSPLRLCVVDDLPSVAQQPECRQPETAQRIDAPIAVDGRMGNLERHYYRFNAAAGQRVSFEVLARRLGSALDPMVRLLDAAGRELTWCDDTPGLSGDPQFSHTFVDAGEYLLELRDIRYRGGDGYQYRLRLGDFPCVTVPHPMAAQRGTQVTLDFAGQDVENSQPVGLLLPPDPEVSWVPVGAKRISGRSSAPVFLALSSGPEFVEAEPNDAPEQANRVELGAGLNGRFETPGDRDRFVFAAKKGDAFIFQAITRRVGAPTDIYMQLLNPKGEKVAEADDAGTDDGKIDFTFPEDGDYTLLIEDLHQRGGTPFAYRIAVARKQPRFELAVAAESLNVPAGGTAMVTVTATRDGYNGPIQVAAIGLPEGIASIPTIIGPGTNSAVLTLTSAENASAGVATPVRIVGTATVGDTSRQATASTAEALKALFNGMPFPPPHLSNEFAVAVAPAAGLRLRAEPSELALEKTKNARVKIIADRQPELDEAIALAVTPEKNGLPNGVSAEVKPIEKGKNEVEIVFSATDKAPTGEFTVVLVGTHKKGDATISQPVPGITLKLQ